MTSEQGPKGPCFSLNCMLLIATMNGRGSRCFVPLDIRGLVNRCSPPKDYGPFLEFGYPPVIQ